MIPEGFRNSVPFEVVPPLSTGGRGRHTVVFRDNEPAMKLRARLMSLHAERGVPFHIVGSLAGVPPYPLRRFRAGSALPEPAELARLAKVIAALEKLTGDEKRMAGIRLHELADVRLALKR